MSAIEVFKKFYVELVKILPMDDVIFIANLYANDLLPFSHKEQIQSMPTEPQKATVFLDHVIQPSLVIGDNSKFIKLLSIMEESNFVVLEAVADHIRSQLKQAPSNTTG